MRPLLTTLFLLNVAVAHAAQPAWTELLVSGEKSPWKKMDAGWIFATDAKLDSKNPKLLEAIDKGKGPVWINGAKSLPDLITKQDYKDCEVHVEFLVGKGSNAGIKFHAAYEIQIRDVMPKDGKLNGDMTGGIYPKAHYVEKKYVHIDEGIAPKVHAAKPAGEWQSMDVVWRSPRFNDKGEKIKNGMVVKATLNDKVIHENQELQHPTGANYVNKEKAAGPFMLQCDHGPVAWRNVKIREIE
ncbi:hypothetical protein BH11PLA2_BH11PLA2_42100 [soil metagenome]